MYLCTAVVALNNFGIFDTEWYNLFRVILYLWVTNIQHGIRSPPPPHQSTNYCYEDGAADVFDVASSINLTDINTVFSGIFAKGVRRRRVT